MSIVDLAEELKSLIVFIAENYDEREMKELEDYRLEKKLKQARALLQDSKRLIRVHTNKVLSNNHQLTKEIVNVNATGSNSAAPNTSGEAGK